MDNHQTVNHSLSHAHEGESKIQYTFKAPYVVVLLLPQDFLFIMFLPSSSCCRSVWMVNSSILSRLGFSQPCHLRGNQNCTVDWSNRTGHRKLLCDCLNMWMWLRAKTRRLTQNTVLMTWLFDLAADVWFLLKCTSTRRRRAIWFLGPAV